MIRFLWINAINSSSEVETRYPNLGIGYLVASLTRAFGADAFTFRVAASDVERALEEFSPDVVGISCVSQNYDRAKEYARLAKGRNLPVLVGGVHISFLPHTLSPAMDVGCVGEGETVIVELMHVFRECGSFPAHRLRDVPGIVFRDEGGELRQTPPPPPVQLDALPAPDRELLPVGSHTYLFTSRGCPYRCSFCASSRFWNRVRFLSAERVVEEIEFLIKRHRVRFISFFDDLFVADKQRFLRIVELLEERGIPGTVKFSCSLRANTVTEEIVQGLARMGVVSVGMGLESGNQRILSWLKGPGITVEQNRAAVTLLRKYGIMPNASFVIGSPDESPEEMLDSLKFIKSVDLGLFDVYTLTPFPGTPVWEIAKERGLISEDDQMEWGKLNVNFETNSDSAIILSNVVGREELVSIYKKFRRARFINNVKKVWSHPMLCDLPRYALKTAQERVLGVLGGRRSR